MSNPILTDAIDRVAGGQDLDAEEAARVLREVMEGNASEAETAAFLIGLRTKGETVQEIAGLAATMRELALPVRARGDLVDTAGTGGGRPTFNVSTTAALIAAGAGCAVAKHGNRSATGLSGSADLLEALGVRIDLPPDAVGRCIDEVAAGAHRQRQLAHRGGQPGDLLDGLALGAQPDQERRRLGLGGVALHHLAQHARRLVGVQILTAGHPVDRVREYGIAHARKLRSICLPWGVSTDSGWNCTPSIGSSAWRTPMITSPARALT